MIYLILSLVNEKRVVCELSYGCNSVGKEEKESRNGWNIKNVEELFALVGFSETREKERKHYKMEMAAYSSEY